MKMRLPLEPLGSLAMGTGRLKRQMQIFHDFSQQNAQSGKWKLTLRVNHENVMVKLSSTLSPMTFILDMGGMDKSMPI